MTNITNSMMNATNSMMNATNKTINTTIGGIPIPRNTKINITLEDAKIVAVSKFSWNYNPQRAFA
jgi:hypothetical protein